MLTGLGVFLVLLQVVLVTAKGGGRTPGDEVQSSSSSSSTISSGSSSDDSRSSSIYNRDYDIHYEIVHSHDCFGYEYGTEYDRYGRPCGYHQYDCSGFARGTGSDRYGRPCYDYRRHYTRGSHGSDGSGLVALIVLVFLVFVCCGSCIIWDFIVSECKSLWNCVCPGVWHKLFEVLPPGGGGFHSPTRDGTTPCYLCLRDVLNTEWDLGMHRRHCAMQNNEELLSYPQPYAAYCPKCSARLRLWPAKGEPFYCDKCTGEEAVLKNSTGENRLNCFACDFDCCVDCADNGKLQKPGEESMA